MFNVRNVVWAAIGLSILIVAGGVIRALETPDSDGLAADSYGTHWNGYRGFLETLESLGVPVERRLLPPSPDMTPRTTLVLWLPDPELVSPEHSYLGALSAWIEQGGRVVVVPRLPSETPRRTMRRNESPRVDVLEALGVKGVVVRRETAAPDDSGLSATDRRLKEALDTFWEIRELDPLEATLEATGTLEPLKARSKRIVVDRKKRARLEIDSTVKPAGLLSYDAAGERRVLAAAFSRGAGEIIVLADELATANALLGRADNGVVAYDLTAGGGRRVVFDEFYHGLAIRGNPFWLLTQPGYGLAAAAGLTLLGLVVWRRGTMLGPPLEGSSASRRSIGEYVDAMSRFFHRARGSRIFILTEVRTGVLRELARRTGLPPAHADVARIEGALARRSTGEARRFVAAVETVDAAIARGRNCSEAEALAALEGISTCL